MKHQIRSITEKEIKRVDQIVSENKFLLEKYVDKLLWWNEKVNLVSRDVPRETLAEHIRHSLFVSVSEEFENHERVLDTGCGGGLPGIPLSICFPNKFFLLNDIVSKKIFAVNDVIKSLDLNDRAEAKIGDVQQLDISSNSLVITKHAFKADQLIEKLKGKEWSSVIFLKGYIEAEEEIEKINEEAYAEIIILDRSKLGSFYEGKSVVTITKKA